VSGKARRALAPVALFALSLLLTTSGCGPSHIVEFTRKEREYEPGKYAKLDPSLQPSVGSLFSEAVGGVFEDTRAVRVGDIVRIRIDESADASGDSTTELNKSSSTNLGVTAVLGLVSALKAKNPEMDPTSVLSYLSEHDFAGSGNTSRKGQLSGIVSVRVSRELPNGDLYLEGTKVVLINNEEYHLYVSGLVRRVDIAQDNSVASSLIADAEVEFTGRGDIADQQRKGMLGRAIDKVDPL